MFTENKTYISEKSVFINDISFPLESTIKIFYFGSEIPFILNVIDDKNIKLDLVDSIDYSALSVEISYDDKLLRLNSLTEEKNVVPANSFNILEYFKLTKNGVIAIKELLSFSFLIESFNDIFTFPDFSEDVSIFNESHFVNNILEFKFEKNTLYKITCTYDGNESNYVYISEKPDFYFSNTEELNKFFKSESYISELYVKEEFPLLIWKKSLEIPSACSFTANKDDIPNEILPLMNKYVIYSCCVDILFYLLNNTTSDNVEMFRSLDKVSLGQFSFSGSANTPYDSYSTSYMRFLRELSSVTKIIRDFFACKGPSNSTYVEFHNPFVVNRRGTL